ncbi:MAG: AAA family ATPase [Gaiellales bacterium]
MSDDDLRAQLGRLVRQLLEDREDDGREKVMTLLNNHLGEGATDLPMLEEDLQSWELPNLQLALDEAITRPGVEARIVGLSAQARHYGLTLADLIQGHEWHVTVGAPAYVNAAVGPGETLACLATAVLLISGPEGPLAAFVQHRHDHAGESLSLEVVSAREGASSTFVADLRRLMELHDVYRGKVLTVTADPMRGTKLEFMERPAVGTDDLILPEGVLEAVHRNVVEVSAHREALVAAGRHLSRGVLLWGPPGTGKTHTVRYLTAIRADATVIIVSGAALGSAGSFVTMARRLQPAMLVLEDVDLVAQERTFGPFGVGSPVLFELMNQMDGLVGDADLAFVLTTNRADALEPALAARPGRIDLALEIPLPDAVARRRLLDLYSRGLDTEIDSPDAIVERTEGVTASFVKELLRAAALRATIAGRAKVTDDDVAAVLDELMSERASLTRVLLGGEQPSGESDPHAWMGGATLRASVSGYSMLVEPD